jgi:RNA polymerase sigma-70 factor (ECF subfamily)
VTDWADKLDGLRAGDLAATNQIIALVTRNLAILGAFEHRDSWDDFIQDVLLALVRKPPSSREPGAIVRHIQTTCRRRYIDEIRRTRGRKRSRGNSQGGDTGWRRNVSLEEIREPDLTDQFWAKQMDLGVRRALERLEERKRRALVAVYLEGFTYEEAAIRLQTPLGTLKGLLRQGLGELRRSIAGGNEAPVSDSAGRSVSPAEAPGPGTAAGDETKT